MTEAVFTNRDETPAVMIELLLTPIEPEPATPSA
jgi:hypothetical protein